MASPAGTRRGRFFYRKEVVKTTWTFRAVVLLALAALGLAHSYWTPALAASLVCAERSGQSQAILIENLDSDYLLFERATALYRAGVAPRVLVPVSANRRNGDTEEGATPNAIEKGTAELMARVAHLPVMELVPVEESEPYALNMARQLRDLVVRERLTSVTVVASGFRSERSRLVYEAVFGPVGISVGCIPVFGTQTVQNWTGTWHGIQEVGLQFVKLQYYRFWVLA